MQGARYWLTLDRGQDVPVPMAAHERWPDAFLPLDADTFEVRDHAGRWGRVVGVPTQCIVMSITGIRGLDGAKSPPVTLLWW